MRDGIDELKTLHTALIDSRNGYQEALEDAEGKGLTRLFQEMIAIREKDSADIASALGALGEAVDSSGSFMSLVHRTVISMRSILTGLDESILPALIDGEERILKLYDEALAKLGAAPTVQNTVAAQRSALVQKIDQMRAMNRVAAK